MVQLLGSQGTLAAPGTQGSWWLGQQEIRCSRRVATHSTTVAWRTPRQRSLEGHSSQGHKDLVTTEATHIHKCRTFSSLWQFCPSEDWVWRWCSCLTVPSVQGHRLPQLQLWLYQSLAASNQKASLASPSLLLHPFMHLEVSLAWGPSLLLGASGTWRAPLTGVLLCCSSVLKHLEGQYLYCSPAGVGLSVWGERGYHDGFIPYSWLSSIRFLPWLPDFSPQTFLNTVSSLMSPQAVSLQSTAGFALGLLHNPYTSAPSHCAF